MDFTGFRSLKGLKILVAEDNKINQQLIGRVLALWDVVWEVVPNGYAVLEKIQSEDYDLVLMDLMMPDMDGYDATRNIRLMDGEYYRNLPIYAFSSNPNPDKIRECNMTGHISKAPLNREELFSVISQHLR